MAVAAWEMDVDDLGARLPTSGTGDDLENLGRASNNLLDHLPSTSNRGRLYVPNASAVPVKVSLSAVYKPTAEPTSAGSARETIDNLCMLPCLPS
jgi:hypothetical protein